MPRKVFPQNKRFSVHFVLCEALPAKSEKLLSFCLNFHTVVASDFEKIDTDLP